MRLNKFIAHCGYCSRRKSEVFIKNKKVTVNGRVITEPWHDIDIDNDAVKINNKLLSLKNNKLLYFKFYKPKGCISSTYDKEGRPTVINFFQKIKGWTSLFPVGRLDYDTQGLIFITNDGDFCQKVIHPSSKHIKKYEAKINGLPDNNIFKKIVDNGIKIDKKKVKPINIKIKKRLKSNCRLTIDLITGENHIVKKIFEKIGYPILKLTRLSIGNINLGSLKPGEFEKLEKIERDEFYNHG